MLPTDRPRVGQILLADEHERPLWHLALVDGPLRSHDLVEATADMHGAGMASGRAVQGTSPSIAKSTLNAPGPWRKRR